MQKNRGYVLLLALVFLGIFSMIGAVLTSSSTTASRLEKNHIEEAQALEIAQAGIDKAAYELNQDQNYTGESGTPLGDGELSIAISTDGSNKIVTATGYVPSAAAPLVQKTVKAELSTNSDVVSFNYGVQAGSGGFNLSGGSTVHGSIYSDGNIDISSGTITGSAIAADPPATAPDQVNDSPSTPPYSITFGNSKTTQDFAQRFKISSATPLNSVKLYIKKVGSPGNETVRIVGDDGGKPDSTIILSATLPSSLVGTSFGWVTIDLPPTPILSTTETYWLVIDGSSSSSKYYVIGANQNGYANGAGMIGQFGSSWSDTSPSGLDGYFELYLGGGTSYIGGGSYVGAGVIGSTNSDVVWAHTVSGISASGSIFCESGSHNNKACDTSRTDPEPAPLPVSDSNIQTWKNEASAGTIINGDEDIGWAGATIGPAVITGNLTVGGGGTLRQTGTIWVKGNVDLGGGGSVRLDSSYGSSDGVIISDGQIYVHGGATLYGSGQSGSYPFLVTTSACPVAANCTLGGSNAIELDGGAGAVAMIAPYGTANIDGGGSLKTVSASEISMSGGASLTYDSGLINANFTSGPGGSWEFVPGTYSVVP